MERTVLEAIEAAGRGVVLAGPEGVIRYVNETVAGMFGCKAEQLMGLAILDLVDARDRPAHASRMEDRRKGRDSLYEVTLRLPGIAPCHCSVHAISLEDASGGFAGTLLILARAPPPDESASDAWIDGLSNREREVLEGLLRGARPRAIGEQLGISVHTVRNHVKAIYRKLGVHSRVELLLQIGPRRA